MDRLIEYIAVPANRNRIVKTLNDVVLTGGIIVTAILLAATYLRP